MSHPSDDIPPLWPIAPRRFRLYRHHDVSGVSGAGHVADGVIWPDGSCAMRWRTDTASTALYNRVEDIVEIHGHNGATVVEMVDR